VGGVPYAVDAMVLALALALVLAVAVAVAAEVVVVVVVRSHQGAKMRVEAKMRVVVVGWGGKVVKEPLLVVQVPP